MKRMTPATATRPCYGLVTNEDERRAFNIGWTRRIIFRLGRFKFYKWSKQRTPLEWESSGHDDEPRDQQTDLFGPYWASIGPDNRVGNKYPNGWSWDVLNFDKDNSETAQGFAPDEAAAKAAVDQWRVENG